MSTIIPTIGRATLSHAVQSVLDQQFDQADFEIIVVNDSGISMVYKDWQDFHNLQIIHTNRRERSVARNAGAAIAQGNYLHFLDDDDWMLPGAFHHFWELIQQKKAAMYYGGYRFVDSRGVTLEECFPNEGGNCFIRFMSGEWQPLQASLFDARIFHSIGGFASLELLRGGDEDVDLTRRISLQADIAGVTKLVAAIRIGRSESTTNYTNLKEQSRVSREKVLHVPGAFARLRDSAISRPADLCYWQGRVAWVYLTSVLWNLQHKKPFTAASRLIYGLTSFILAGKNVISPSFWRGATRPHIANGWLTAKK
ncbi:MAG: glycosyltransferase family A protein [Anaerolineales bacterium]